MLAGALAGLCRSRREGPGGSAGKLLKPSACLSASSSVVWRGLGVGSGTQVGGPPLFMAGGCGEILPLGEWSHRGRSWSGLEGWSCMGEGPGGSWRGLQRPSASLSTSTLGVSMAWCWAARARCLEGRGPCCCSCVAGRRPCRARGSW